MFFLPPPAQYLIMSERFYCTVFFKSSYMLCSMVSITSHYYVVVIPSNHLPLCPPPLQGLMKGSTTLTSAQAPPPTSYERRWRNDTQSLAINSECWRWVYSQYMYTVLSQCIVWAPDSIYIHVHFTKTMLLYQVIIIISKHVSMEL